MSSRTPNAPGYHVRWHYLLLILVFGASGQVTHCHQIASVFVKQSSIDTGLQISSHSGATAARLCKHLIV